MRLNQQRWRIKSESAKFRSTVSTGRLSLSDESVFASCLFAPYFFRELLTRVPVEFFELRFPWNLLNLEKREMGSLLSGLAIVLPLKGDSCLLPGIPLSNRTSFPAESLFSTITGKSPSFCMRLSFKHSYRYLLSLLASYLNTKPQFIQIFKSFSMVSGESEFFAIPSSFHGNLHGLLSPTVADHFYLRSAYAADNLSAPIFPYSHHQQVANAIQRKGMPTPLMGPFNHGQKVTSAAPKLFGHSNSSVKLFYQRLSLPIRELESLCQLRCLFVDSAQVREVAKIILIAPRSSTVADLLCIARAELRRIGVVTADFDREKSSTPPESSLLSRQDDSSNSSQFKRDHEPPLRLLETLNSWIIQQYSPDQLTSRLQLLDNRLLRIEIIPPDECPTFRNFSRKGSISCAVVDGSSSLPSLSLQVGETSALPNLLYPISFKDLVDIHTEDDDDEEDDEVEEEEEDDDEEDDVNGEEEDEEEDDDDLAVCDSEENENGEFDEEDDEDEEDDDDDGEEEELNNQDFQPRKILLTNEEDDISSVLKLMLNPPDGNIEKAILSSPEVFDSYKSSDSVSCESILPEPEGLSFSLDIVPKDSVDSIEPVLLHESHSPELAVKHQEYIPVSPGSLGKSTLDEKSASFLLSPTKPTPESKIVDLAPTLCSSVQLSGVDDTLTSITSAIQKPISSMPSIRPQLLQISENLLVPKSLVVTCGHFFRGDPSYGGFGLPFTLVLHHGERISSLLGRLRCRLGASAQEAEKWRLAVLPGPIPAISSALFEQFRANLRGLEPLMPTQESLLMMRPTYLPTEPDACLNLCHFLTPQMSASFNTAMLAATRSSSPSAANFAEASRSDFSRLIMLFGLRPWLGIEHKIQPKRPRCMLSEKPIRILN